MYIFLGQDFRRRWNGCKSRVKKSRSAIFDKIVDTGETGEILVSEVVKRLDETKIVEIH